MNEAQRSKLQKELKVLEKDILNTKRTIAMLQTKLEGLYRKKSQIEMMLTKGNA